MAIFATSYPSQSGVIRIGDQSLQPSMTTFASHVQRGHIAHFDTDMALAAGRSRMGTDQGEARRRMIPDRSQEVPTILTVTILTSLALLALVQIHVATRTTLGGEALHGTAVIVTAQALGAGVRALQSKARLHQVIEFKVGARTVPILALVAEFAIQREGLVGNHRPIALPPLMLCPLPPIGPDAVRAG